MTKKTIAFLIALVVLFVTLTPIVAQEYKPQWGGPADGKEAKFAIKYVRQSIDIPIQPTYFHREGEYSGYLEFSGTDEYNEYYGEMILVYSGYIYKNNY